MAGMFYSLEEAMEKLGRTEEQIKAIVKQGKLREFRDGSNLLFKVNEVDALIPKEAVETAPEPVEEEPGVAEVLAEEDEITLVPEPELELELKPEPEAEVVKPAEPTIEEEPIEEIGLAQGDTTSISSEELNVLGDTDIGHDLTSDTRSETKVSSVGDTSQIGIGGSGEMSIEKIEEDVNLDSFGSGSGLLDLSLQADDTSLGGILDEIYTPGGEEGKAAAVADAALDLNVAEGPGPSEDELLSAEAPVPQMMMQAYAEPEPDKSSNVFGLMLFLPLLAVIYTAIVAAAYWRGATPAIMTQIQSLILYVVGGAVVVSLIWAVVGFMPARSSDGAPEKPKRIKPVKQKKSKKDAKAEAAA